MKLSATAASMLCSIGIGALASGTAHAQPKDAQPNTAPAQATPQSPADQQNSNTGSEAIVVTANKRAQRAVDVPMSVTAVAGKELEARRIVDLQDLTTQFPGISLQRGGGSGTPASQRIIIRGLNTGGQGATVATTVDDIPLSFSSGVLPGASFATDFEPYDLNRVEVLRGPQGTLYGANAEGGLIKYVTNAPNLRAFEAGGDVGIFDRAHARDVGGFAKGYVNVPIARDVVAARATGYYESQPGWIDDPLRGTKDVNSSKRYGFRLSVMAQATPDLQLKAMALHQSLKTKGYDIVDVLGYQDPQDMFALTSQGYAHNTYLPEPSKTTSTLFGFQANYDLGPAVLQSITSYGRVETRYDFDNVIYGTASTFCTPTQINPLCFGRPNTTLISDSTSDLKKFNQEFRLASDNGAAANGSGLDWQIGAYYTHEKSQFELNYQTRDLLSGQVVTTLASPTTATVFLSDIEAKYRELAGYAHLTYYFSPKFQIEAGARVFNNHQSFVQSQGGAIFSPPDFVTLPAVKSKETDWTFSTAASYHFDRNTMIYARVASGYRPGGPNPSVPTNTGGPFDSPGEPPASFTSDRTVNYEAGFKGLFFGNVLSADVAAFYIDWTDIQVTAQVVRGFTAYPVVLNAGKAVSKGFEWNFYLRPFRGFSIGWLGAYTDAKLSRDIPDINGFKNDELPFVPRWQTTLTADYEWPISGDFRAHAGGNYSFTGRRFSDFAFRPADSHIRLPNYDTWGLQAGVRNDRWGVELYGKNLGDSRGITSFSRGRRLVLPPVFGLPPLNNQGTAGLIRPREIGLRLTANLR